ncbi:type II secretion system minor pseudopilin GspI [Yersinia enterocolitica]|uniref:type II secretion system minor pseudopilin GspI n=2 Tax=Yersinia enterocolitica TaxID=630 RepID=UPI0005E7313A|nr:type II secretion system minor pseudopilin GspI [Yersinia enterocolitica]MDA5486752.1 type II secretion system minor pseudopilin GspI [Yersinia enterocolitica]NGN38731.1 type II secretion system minor pseudopilin GspI [Yersinia enterocolitica subsp. palearctica]CNG22019.1 general secretion pathway protein I [Yersinia enterocolitica]CNG97480.1 general secretion pathway protein I [Yersinia enterocolitica]CNH03420.1 general secretion pathway protein I [Yersinia enterocolitica]
MSSYNGFTLLESLLSMAIFSVVGISLMLVISEQLIQVKKLENKVVASLVAENILVDIKLTKNDKSENWLKGSDFIINNLWYWQSKEIKMRTISVITIEVRSQENSKVPDFTLEGYRVINE